MTIIKAAGEWEAEIPGMETTKRMTAHTVGKPVPRKRAERKSVQPLRFWAQVFSLLVNVWIGVQFYLWVQGVRAGAGTELARPPGVEGWLPIGSLVGLRYFFETGILNTIHPAGLVILVVILLTALVFKKGFCSWVCPVGFISEMLGAVSDKLFGRRIKPWRWLDWPLRSLKYLLLLFFVWAVFWSMSSESIKAFLYSDYNVISDVLMLRFFADISLFALSVIGVLFALSLVIRGFWCRYLCPYGALLGLVNLISPTRIRRNAASCIDCAACARVCPAFIKVDKVTEVVSDECVGCMACVDSCPVKQTLEIHMVRKNRTVASWKWAAVLLVFFWGALLAAKLWGPWQNAVTNEQYHEYMPGIEQGQYTHPSY